MQEEEERLIEWSVFIAGNFCQKRRFTRETLLESQ